ncbi:MAG: hypothetical protein R3C16_03570 [Hyphomonadaceae bacterium]
MLRKFGAAILAGALFLAACADERGPASTQTSETFLLNTAAEDFRAHVAPEGLQFRNVHAGVMNGEDGVAAQLLCGEFSGPSGDWTPFATIRTDPYENWIGGVAESHCTRANTSLESATDLSDALTRAYAAGR